MTDIAAIANLAASKLGEEDRLISLDDDTHLARSIKAVWDDVRRLVLREHPWNFAMKRWSLASRTLDHGETIFPFAYAYPLPPELLRFHELLGPETAIPGYQIEGGDILSDDTGPLIIRGVQDVPDTWRWDAAFVEAFSFRLAFQIADRVTGDRARQNAMLQGFMMALRSAKSVDGRENPPIPANEGSVSWLTARFGQ